MVDFLKGSAYNKHMPIPSVCVGIWLCSSRGSVSGGAFFLFVGERNIGFIGNQIFEHKRRGVSV